MSNEQLVQLISPLMNKKYMNLEQSYLLKAVGIIKERITFYQDILNEGEYLFSSPQTYDEKTVNKKWKSESVDHLKALRIKIECLDNFSAENLEQVFQNYLQSNNIGFGKVMPVLRVSVTGRGMGPSMFLIMDLLGLEEVLQRIDNAVKNLGNGQDNS